MKNLAERTLEHYKTDEFASKYKAELIEFITKNEAYTIGYLQYLFNYDAHALEFFNIKEPIGRVKIQEVYAFIKANPEPFIKRFSPDKTISKTVLLSINFGEQCEQMKGRNNHSRDKDYYPDHLSGLFKKQGFRIKMRKAYYDLSDHGLYMELCTDELLNEFL